MASIVVNGDTSGSVTLSAPAVSGSSVLTLPAVTDTVAGIAATQTLTNKTINASQLVDASITQAKLGTNLVGNGPAFSAYANAAQTITAATFTQAQFQVEEFDTNSNFSSNTFTPTVAGYYLITFNIKFAAVTVVSRAIVSVYKNGITTGRQFDSDLDNTTTFFVNGSKLVSCNGSTDAITIFIYMEGTGTLTTGGNDLNTNYFSGVLVRAA